MRLWVTRTEPGATTTARRLADMGHQAVVRPVLAYRPLDAAAPDLSDVAAIAFSSALGVTAFSDLTARRDLPVFVTGRATAEVARRVGFDNVLSADGDLAEMALVITVAKPAGSILWACAAEPAGDLAALLGAGFEVRRLPVYETIEADWSVPADVDGLLVASPKAGRLLAARLTKAEASRLNLYAISAAAAAPLWRLPFASVATAARPSETEMLALIRS
jgi:uroporphyrinogen-III synthase